MQKVSGWRQMEILICGPSCIFVLKPWCKEVGQTLPSHFTHMHAWKNNDWSQFTDYKSPPKGVCWSFAWCTNIRVGSNETCITDDNFDNSPKLVEIGNSSSLSTAKWAITMHTQYHPNQSRLCLIPSISNSFWSAYTPYSIKSRMTDSHICIISSQQGFSIGTTSHVPLAIEDWLPLIRGIPVYMRFRFILWWILMNIKFLVPLWQKIYQTLHRIMIWNLNHSSQTIF